MLEILWTLPPVMQVVAMALVFVVPAYVVGHLLPSDARLGGPLHGVTVSFTGAAAVYVALMPVRRAPRVRPGRAPTPPTRWSRSRASWCSTMGAAAPRSDVCSASCCRGTPTASSPGRRAAFALAFDLPVMRRPSGRLDFGDLRKVILEYPCFGALTINLQGPSASRRERGARRRRGRLGGHSEDGAVVAGSREPIARRSDSPTTSSRRMAMLRPILALLVAASPVSAQDLVGVVTGPRCGGRWAARLRRGHRLPAGSAAGTGPRAASRPTRARTARSR